MITKPGTTITVRTGLILGITHTHTYTHTYILKHTQRETVTYKHREVKKIAVDQDDSFELRWSHL